jgi:hypothetical protein
MTNPPRNTRPAELRAVEDFCAYSRWEFLEEARATFRLDEEFIQAEPDVGIPTAYWSVRAQLVCWHFGDLTLSREMLLTAVGASELARIEDGMSFRMTEERNEE